MSGASQPACTPLIQLPAGNWTISEVPLAEIELVAAYTFPIDRIVDSDLTARTATIRIESGDPSRQTIAFFRNAPTP